MRGGTEAGGEARSRASGSDSSDVDKPWEQKKVWKAARKLTGTVYRVTQMRDF
jgi:hypothetical protein